MSSNTAAMPEWLRKLIAAVLLAVLLVGCYFWMNHREHARRDERQREKEEQRRKADEAAEKETKEFLESLEKEPAK